MKLIVGLGNPGKEYANTRHNCGYMLVDRMASLLNVEMKVDKDKECYIAEANVSGEKLILIQPTTYMNLSGQSVAKVIKYYKIDIDDILVIFDDLDLEIGEHKIKPFGGTGGHKGIKSIIECLGTEDIKRLRIGIGKPESMGVVDYVLQKFSKKELSILDEFYQYAYDICKDYVELKFDNFMNKYNSLK